MLRRWIADAGAMHLHVHFSTNAATVALLYRHLGGIPYSFTIHGPEEFASGNAASIRKWCRPKMGRCVANSSACRVNWGSTTSCGLLAGLRTSRCARNCVGTGPSYYRASWRVSAGGYYGSAGLT